MKKAAMAYWASNDGITERNDVVMRELPQVYYIASRIRERLPKCVDTEDLIQAGVLGLLDAYRNFDSSKNTQFATFAKFRIRGAILDSLRQLDWGSRTLRRKGRAIASSVAKLESELGRHPSDEELALELGMPLDKLQNVMLQLDGLYLVGQQGSTSHGHDESYDLIESAQSEGRDNPFDLCMEGERREHLIEAVSRMSEREQLILSLYYQEELTMKEVAEVVGIAVSRVSQIHAAAMVKLRFSLEHIRVAAKVRLQSTNRISAVRPVSTGGSYDANAAAG